MATPRKLGMQLRLTKLVAISYSAAAQDGFVIVAILKQIPCGTTQSTLSWAQVNPMVDLSFNCKSSFILNCRAVICKFRLAATSTQVLR